MVLKRSRWGKEFLACSAYPKCKNARNVGAAPGAETPEAGAEEGATAGISTQSED
jgi:ssDNA-binding Zn-finger/Zn-ribbon topoisomerase 1